MGSTEIANDLLNIQGSLAALKAQAGSLKQQVANLLAPAPPPPPPVTGTRPYRVGVMTDGNVSNYTTDKAWAPNIDLVQVFSSALDGSTPMAAYPTGTNFIVSWQALLGAGSLWDLSAIPSGIYDSTYNAWLTSAAVFNVKIIRLLYGMDGDWAPWSINQGGTTASDGTLANKPYSSATYIAAFQHLAALIRTKIPGVLIEWSVVSGNPPWPNNPNSYLSYWPGSAYADVVGVEIHECQIGAWTPNGVLGAIVNPYDVLAFAQDNEVQFSVPSWDASNGDSSFFTSMAAFMDFAGNSALYQCYNEELITTNISNSDQLYTNAFPSQRSAWNASSFGSKVYLPVAFP